MARRQPTDAEKLVAIRDWFGRHRGDYCMHDAAPPQIWTEYFEWLLMQAEAQYGLTRTD